jgi:hydrogenase-4 component H
MKRITKVRVFGGLASRLFYKPVTVRKSFGFVAYRSRGLPRRDALKCTGCGACNERCSSGATSVTDHEGFRTISINSLRCLFCARCADVCPEKALDLFFGTDDTGDSPKMIPSGEAGVSDPDSLCLNDPDIDLLVSDQYAKALSLSHERETQQMTVDTILPLQHCRVCGAEMPVTEKYLQVIAGRMLDHLRPETAKVVRKDLELYLTACIYCRQKFSVEWNTYPRKFV